MQPYITAVPFGKVGATWFLVTGTKGSKVIGRRYSAVHEYWGVLTTATADATLSPKSPKPALPNVEALDARDSEQQAIDAANKIKWAAIRAAHAAARAAHAGA